MTLFKVIEQSGLDPTYAQGLIKHVKLGLDSKNEKIRNLEYSIHHATKAYNDAIRVYEAKLTEFGIPADEIGFKELETRTSMMPAGLVSS